MGSHVRQIGIFGTFDVRNYGDLLFPLLAEFELTKRLVQVHIRPFSYYAKSPPDWPFSVSSLSELPESIGSLDGALIGGGHIVRFDQDIAPGYKPPTGDLHHPTGYWLTPALMAQQAGVPTVWNSPGVHGDFPAWSEPLLRLAFRDCPYVAVRDEPSRHALARFASEITVTPDTAFGVAGLLDRQRGVDAARKWREVLELTRPYVVVQATTGLEAFGHMVRNHPAVMTNHSVVVLPIGPVLGDRDEFVMADLPDAIRLPNWPDPLSLAALIGGAEGVVGTSMHLAITALSCGVPVFRPADWCDGKYGVLSNFETVNTFDSQATIAPAAFSAKLGRNKPSARVQEAVNQLSGHWDRIADVINRGRRPVTLTFHQHWQSLPNFLERRSGMLNLAKIESTKLETVPFDWAMIDELFTRHDAEALSTTYPHDQFKTVTGNDGEKSYCYEARSLIGMGKSTISHDARLSPAWRQLGLDLLSPEYRAAMSRLIGIDLASAAMEVNVFHFGPGAWLGPHLDLKDKIVTHVLYFNSSWKMGDGGCLKILRSKAMHDEFAEISPEVGNSSVLVRSEKSWHAVSQVAERSRSSRRSVTVTFYHPGSVSTMWPPDDETPLHNYQENEPPRSFWQRLGFRPAKRAG